MQIQTGVTARPAVGQTVCGDAWSITPFSQGLLLCLADGLGHGPEARTASTTACHYAETHASEPLEAMLHGMNAALAGLRGAAVSVLVLEPVARRALFAGVGNVELRSASRGRIAPPTVPGVVGHGVRRVRVWEYPISEGDLFVLMSDGISSRFELDPISKLEPQALADHLVNKHHKTHDDACAVVARLAGAVRGA
ncbi:Phosphoserine phosphatase RsbX [Minicystis rosea]|nr:Phosphoserine phosphatase RsbX [Minicystis rosea]